MEFMGLAVRLQAAPASVMPVEMSVMPVEMIAQVAGEEGVTAPRNLPFGSPGTWMEGVRCTVATGCRPSLPRA